MGIEDLVEGEVFGFRDLEVGKIYRGELIIDRDKSCWLNMTTLSRGGDKIHIGRYLVKFDTSEERVTSINNSGGQEYNPEDELYKELNSKLKEAGL